MKPWLPAEMLQADEKTDSSSVGTTEDTWLLPAVLQDNVRVAEERAVSPACASRQPRAIKNIW